jgi:hypothetical protein
MQVVMKLIGNLEGVSPFTQPRHPFSIVNRITLKAQLGHLQFCIVRCSAVAPPEGYSEENSHAADVKAMSKEAGGGAASKRHSASKLFHVHDRRYAYRGRAHVGAVWLSTVLYSGSRRGVRARCGEEVVMQMRHKKDWLRDIYKVKGELCVLSDEEVAAGGFAPCVPPLVEVTMPGDKLIADGEVRTGIWATAEHAAALPSLAELQKIQDCPLDEMMENLKQKAAEVREAEAARLRARPAQAANFDEALDV